VMCQTCGGKLKCLATRDNRLGVARRYKCDCGARVSTIEVHVPDAAQGKPLRVHSSVVDRPDVERIKRLLAEANSVADDILMSICDVAGDVLASPSTERGG